MAQQMIVASTSTLYGGTYLSYLDDELKLLFNDCKEIIFIPYARPGGVSHDAYTEQARKAFNKIRIKIKGIHTFSDPVEALENAQGIFTGGGNTFVLVHMLYKNQLMKPLRKNILNGTPYLGTSAGSNICGLTMQTTNDMPIVYPPSFKTLGVLPFQINPHYQDPIKGSEHMGETRETRIKEYHAHNSVPVIGLREGSWLDVSGKKVTLKGALSARIFEQAKRPYELTTGEKIYLD